MLAGDNIMLQTFCRFLKSTLSPPGGDKLETEWQISVFSASGRNGYGWHADKIYRNCKNIRQIHGHRVIRLFADLNVGAGAVGVAMASTPAKAF